MSRARVVGSWLLLAVLLIVVGAWGFDRYRDIEKQTLDGAARAKASGKFVQLTDGVTHYELAGPDTGPVVVLAAGASVPGYIWDPTFTALSAAGFRTLRYDYFGRGFSDRPDIWYTQDVYVRQLADLLDSLGMKTPVVVAGLSYGGTVITSFAAAHPDRVRALIYVDPAIHRAGSLPFVMHVPIARDILLESAEEGWATGQLDDFLHPERYPNWISRYRLQMQYKGFRAGRLNDMLGNEHFDQRAQLAQVGKDPRPVLVVWGKQDQTVPFSRSAELLAALPHAQLVAVDSARHLPQWEQPEVTHQAMIAFLQSLPAAR